ncbi:unnamed protein product, partial [Symbiodinium necroappetens]
MIEKAWAWAHQNKCLRKNEIHGEEEAKLILSEDFDLLHEEGQEISMGGTVEMEDDSGFLLQDELPSVHASSADIFAGKVGSSAGSGSGDAGKALESFSSAASFKIKDQLKDSLKALKTHFKELQSRQADAIQRHPD